MVVFHGTSIWRLCVYRLYDTGQQCLPLTSSDLQRKDANANLSYFVHCIEPSADE